jgi:DNA polymerase III delta prime subunit
MYIGNEQAATVLRSALSAERGHAFLLSGPAGVGKNALARELIAEKIGRPLKENDPDILMLEIEGAHIGRMEVAPIAHHLSRRPIIGKWNIVFLADAQRLTPEAANSLLVLLENPPATALLFLTTTSLGAVLSTIRSRCVPIVFGTVAQEEIIRGLKQLFPEQTESTIARCAELAHGLPGEAISLLNDPHRLAAAEEQSRAVEAWIDGGLTERLGIAKQLGDDRERTLRFLTELASSPARGWYRGALTAERQLLRNVQPRAVLEAFAMLEV